MKTIFLANILLLLICFSCQETPAMEEVGSTEVAASEVVEKPLTTAEKLLTKTLNAHGGDLYDQANYSFVFRKKLYTFKNDDKNFSYTVTSEKDGNTTVDQLKNGAITRTVNGEPQELTEKEAIAYTGALNSVIYFATLPHKLLDEAVNLETAGTETVKGKQYDLLKVYFDEEGGGTDHDDNFLYWINQESGRIDYLAYDYKVEKGGVRFRSAYNPRVMDGILFQDYVNYKAPLGTPLTDLAKLYEGDKLEELSRIETEDVKRLD